ncbi:MAG: hypothetical protein R3291_02620 [Thermoplasmata archaeon]|nr:hypothetical protein [Thermoplasmata archaeon]
MSDATKSIKITIALWPHGLDPKDPKAIVKGEAWDYGSVYLTRNSLHGIEQTGPLQFADLGELESAVRSLLAANNITLHSRT